ncbi:head GIN domain-containing protein [Labilibaculum sp.]|uniref:head GIN domain-containing protein n=1 Tax=Labilibaculum sp. TaxID=2060723 RepID=UPI002AA5FCB0|nr:head GIN domain-containing protein [Labilibaculum sp.]
MNPIRKIFSLVSILFISFICILPAKADGIKGNGNVQTEEREVSPFETIKVNGAFTIILSQNDDYSLKVVADENLMEIIKTKVKGDVLYISTEKSIYKSKELKLYIGFKHLSELKANGAISLKSDQMLRFDELDIEINGASSADLELSANRLTIDNSGASTIKLAGKCDEISIDISGAGSVNAYDLLVKRGSIDISGVGSGKVCVEEDLRVSISGIGSVKYKGEPKITSDISFLGSLKKY